MRTDVQKIEKKWCRISKIVDDHENHRILLIPEDREDFHIIMPSKVNANISVGDEVRYEDRGTFGWLCNQWRRPAATSSKSQVFRNP